MEVSVVVPTYNRENSILECAQALLEQDFIKDYEILIIDDGSDRELSFSSSINRNSKIRYFKIKHGGPAIARNYGVKMAKGRYIIFIGDDIICPKEFIKSHYDFLSLNPGCASVGATVWHSLTPNRKLFLILQYIGLGNFSTGNKDDCGFYSFTTSNIAIAKSYFDLEQFDENFPYPAMEDNELGFRLYRHGLKIKYNEKAVAYHKHAYTPEHLKKRQWQLGYSIGYFVKKQPEVRKLFIRHNLMVHLCFLLKLKVFSFLKFYHQIAVCVCEKYRGIKDFQKNVKANQFN